MKHFVLLILVVFASEKKKDDTGNDSKFGERIGQNEEVVVKIEEDEYVKVNKSPTSKFIGVSYYEKESKWYVQRWRKGEKKVVSNGCYSDEETAAHASDTLARKLMENGARKLKLNFPDDHIEVYAEEKNPTSKFIGVIKRPNSKWLAQRWSQNDNKKVYNGYYNDAKTAAHASDNLARNLMENGALKLKLNFPDDHIEVYSKKKKPISKFIGVFYDKNNSKWRAQRWSKGESKIVSNGYYDDEKIAAYASDNLARKLMKNDEQHLKLNFPDDHTEVHPADNQKKRKRQNEITREQPQNN